MQQLLKKARANFGRPGTRSFSFIDRMFYLNIPKPRWCNSSDGLYSMFENKWQVYESGIVVWAHIIQANRLLFEPGKDNCPASVIFAPNWRQDVDVEELGHIAHSLYELKGTVPDEPHLRQLAEGVTDERMRTFGVRIPPSVSGHLRLVESTTFVTRKHLPNRVLTLPFFPIVVASQAPYYNFPLPSRFWPKPFIEFWNSARSL